MKKNFVLLCCSLFLLSCNQTDDRLETNDDFLKKSNLTAKKISGVESKTADKVSIKAFYSSLSNQHYYSTGDYPPSYFPERVIGFVNTQYYLSPAITIWYNVQTGDSYITPYENELQNKPNWVKKASLGGSDPNFPSYPVHEYFNASTQSHFYTTSFSELEYGKNGFVYNGIRFYVNYGDYYNRPSINR